MKISRAIRPDWKRKRVIITGCGGIHVDVPSKRIGPIQITIFGHTFIMPFQKDPNACRKWINHMIYPIDYQSYSGFTPLVYPFGAKL